MWETHQGQHPILDAKLQKPNIRFKRFWIMGQVHPKPTSVRCVLVYGFDSVDDTPSPFIVVVDSKHVNVLILAKGKKGENPVLNQNSPFSGSTLIVPELATILTALASFAAFALYTAKRRKLF